jgi:hypothetical protein
MGCHQPCLNGLARQERIVGETMMPTCDGCHEPLSSGQLYSGIALAEGESIAGHYLCVMKMLTDRDPLLALKAIQKGVLPNIDPETIVDGKLEKFVSGMPKPEFLVAEMHTGRLPDPDEQGSDDTAVNQIELMRRI